MKNGPIGSGLKGGKSLRLCERTKMGRLWNQNTLCQHRGPNECLVFHIELWRSTVSDGRSAAAAAAAAEAETTSTCDRRRQNGIWGGPFEKEALEAIDLSGSFHGLHLNHLLPTCVAQSFE
jgi:hypothetical protein